MTENVLTAGAAAERIAESVRTSGSIEVALAALEQSVAELATEGVNLDSVLPGGNAEGLGFGLRPDAGRRLLARYANALHDDVCGADGSLHKILSQGLAASGASIVTAIIAFLGIPMLVAPVVAPVAGVMLALGHKAFCEEFPSELAS